MKKALVIAWTLFCLAILVSQLRPKPGNLPGETAAVAPQRGPASPEDTPAPSRQVRSSFTSLVRTRFNPPVPIPQNTNAAPMALFVEWKGQWYPATVLQSDGHRRLIHYTGYGDQWNEWVGPERMREAAADSPAETTTEIDPRDNRLPAPGDFVVRWGERWWRAEVLDRNGDQTLIHYIGYGPEWDEWVTPDRAKTFSEADAAAEAQRNTDLLIIPPAPVAPAKSTAPFQVEWGGSWWPANVLHEENGRFFIHYEGYADTWDEWVTVERLRVPGRDG